MHQPRRRTARERSVHPGRMGHAPDFTVLHFPAERAVFVVDYVAVRTVPGSNTLQNGAPIAEYVNAIKAAVEVLDFDIVMTGHGPNGKKSDLADHRQYFEHLASPSLTASKRVAR
jgi:glyoxylase-like metal-dependent hydrolase (beta-lactamase superfamily II)